MYCMIAISPRSWSMSFLQPLSSRLQIDGADSVDSPIKRVKLCLLAIVDLQHTIRSLQSTSTAYHLSRENLNDEVADPRAPFCT